MSMLSRTDSIASYITAKDHNRPHEMVQAFAPDAQLVMAVKTDAISFPPHCHGRDAITDTLVRRFAQSYENVYTLCLAHKPDIQTSAFSCDWLVVMTEKESRSVRVGCGRYDWRFAAGSHWVEHLTITIEAMHSLSPSCHNSVMSWVSHLPYPWCPVPTALATCPQIDELGFLRHHLQAMVF
jgi:hypothetical protein